MKDRPDASKFDEETGEQLHDEHGREIPDPTPMQPPIGYNRQPSLAEQMRAMILSEQLAQEARAAGHETFEEADDFDVGDDFDAERHSPYEANFDPMTPQERAALSTEGRDVNRILTPEEQALAAAQAAPKPKKTPRGAASAAPLSEAPSAEDQSDPEGGA